MCSSYSNLISRHSPCITLVRVMERLCINGYCVNGGGDTGHGWI